MYFLPLVHFSEACMLLQTMSLSKSNSAESKFISYCFCNFSSLLPPTCQYISSGSSQYMRAPLSQASRTIRETPPHMEIVHRHPTHFLHAQPQLMPNSTQWYLQRFCPQSFTKKLSWMLPELSWLLILPVKSTATLQKTSKLRICPLLQYSNPPWPRSYLYLLCWSELSWAEGLARDFDRRGFTLFNSRHPVIQQRDREDRPTVWLWIGF